MKKTCVLIVTLTLGLLAAPLAVEAQQAGKVHRVALVFTVSPVSEMAGPDPIHLVARVFLHALRALGYVEGQNLIFERRSAEGKFEQLPEILAELVRLKVDVIVTVGDEMTQRAMEVTTTVPIVMLGGRNPVELGLVQSLARPGGNVTGLIVTPSPEIEAKRLQLLKEAVPKISRVAFLGTKRDRDTPAGESVRAAARRLGITLRLAELTSDGYALAFAMLTRDRPDALFAAHTPQNFGYRHAIVDFAVKSRLPATHFIREFVDAGGLMSYGDIVSDRAGRAAMYVDKILKGAKPANLPVEQPRKFELFINLKTAKALGLTIPESVLLRADEVIR
jgi:putative ABC transport system substrate-binding protein